MKQILRILTNPVVLLILLLILPTIPLLYPGLPLTHDGQDHVARIANFYRSLSEGNIVPRWADNLNWGYGHPILMFLYPLPSYMASIFLFLGFTVVDSTKIVFGLSFILSGLAMFLFASSQWNRKVGFLAALLYTFAPYRFVDLYVRGAIGEHVAFIWPPIICYLISRIKNQESRIKEKQINFSINNIFDSKLFICYIGLSVSVAFLILSHNALAIMFLPVIFLYFLYLFFFESKNRTLFTAYCLLSSVSGFLLSFFFWFPAFFEGKYTLRDIVTRGEFSERFTSIGSFFYSLWNYGGTALFSKEIGALHWLGLFLAIFFLLKNKIPKIRKILQSGLIVIFLVTLFLMLPISNFIWNNFTLLQKFQFPWRFLSLSVFVVSIISAFGISEFINKLSLKFDGSKKQFRHAYRLPTLALATVGLLLTVISFPMMKPKGYLIKPESFYTGVYPGTTDTGESSPIWSVRFMEHRPKASLEIIDGKADINSLKRTTTFREYEIKTFGNVRILENTLYFPGWQVLVDGKTAEIEFQDPEYRGLMTFNVSDGIHKVDILFKDTKLRYFSNLVSLISVCIMSISLILFLLWNKKRG